MLECDCAYVECFQRNVEWLNGMNHDKCEGQVKETGFSVFKKKKKKQNLIKSACMRGNGQPVMHAQL